MAEPPSSDKSDFPHSAPLKAVTFSFHPCRHIEWCKGGTLPVMESNSFRGWTVTTASTPILLQEALDWMNVSHGRAKEYHRLCADFAEGKTYRKSFFAYNESGEILDIHAGWKNHARHFPGIDEKIRHIFKAGSVLSDQENSRTGTNRARNDAFVYVLTGKLLHLPDTEVLSVDGIQNVNFERLPQSRHDIIARILGRLIAIECKRPLSKDTLEANVKKAMKQLQTWPADRLGIVTVDVSRVLLQGYDYLHASSPRQLIDFLAVETERLLMPFARQFNKSNMGGSFGFARVPHTMPVNSRILQIDNTPYKWQHRVNSAVSYLGIKNARCSDTEVMDHLATHFAKTEHDIPPGVRPMV